VALDFSSFDDKMIRFALGQGQPGCTYILIHVVESVSARIHGEASDDLEARKDLEKLNDYVNQITAMGYKATGKLGYKNRKSEIVRIVREESAEILVMGGHGHAGVSDWIYGETINQVRHEIKIPVLIVNR
jgi:manganese transport protein